MLYVIMITERKTSFTYAIKVDTAEEVDDQEEAYIG